MEIRPSRIEGFIEISCDTAHIIRRKGSDDTTENRITTVPSGTEDEWEEVVLAAVLAEKERREREEAYKADVVTRIRARYSSDDENAILRKMLALTSMPMPAAEGAELEAVEHRAQQVMAEFEEYNAFAEECKAEARKVMNAGTDNENNN
jgi:hypothetical protein